MRSRLDGLRDLHIVFGSDNTFDGDNSVGVLRYHRPRRDGHCATRPQGPIEWSPCRGLADDPKRSGQIGRAHREAVHRRACEGRKIHTRPYLLRNDTPGGITDRNEFARERPSVLEHPPLRLLERE